MSVCTPNVRANDIFRHPDLQKGIYGVGFKKPSKIQERALPLLLNNPSVAILDSAFQEDEADTTDLVT